MELSITRSENLKTKPDDANLGFGTLFTDHMLNMDYALDGGWQSARIEPYGSIEMDPATMFLHYGQCCSAAAHLHFVVFEPWQARLQMIGLTTG